MKNKTCQRAEGFLVSQQPSISGAQLNLRTSSCSGLPFLGGWWQDLHSGHRKKHTSFRKNAQSGVWGGAEVSSTRGRSPLVNLRRSLLVDAWNVLSLRDGDGPGICLGDGQTEAPGLLAESRHDTATCCEKCMLPLYCMYNIY